MKYNFKCWLFFLILLVWQNAYSVCIIQKYESDDGIVYNLDSNTNKADVIGSIPRTV